MAQPPGVVLQNNIPTHRSLSSGWPRITLLVMLGYEAAGCLIGGILLAAAPDGRYMNMPVEMMHGVFPSFLIPGIILFGLGILNTFAFWAVLRQWRNDWLLACLALGGLFIWFVVEIIILRELHWLHLMWGLPVLVGWIMVIPLWAERRPKIVMSQSLLLFGIISSLWYIIINLFVPTQYEGYDVASLTVSELSAIGAPTRILWVLVVLLYPLFFAAFGWGILYLANDSRALRMTGRFILFYSLFNLFWPPMHQREVIAAGGETLSDTLHLVWAFITLLLMLLIMGWGASALGKSFRYFTMAIVLIFLIFGSLSGIESPGINSGVPTPYLGIWERINIAAFMIWVIVFAVALRSKTGISVNSLN